MVLNKALKRCSTFHWNYLHMYFSSPAVPQALWGLTLCLVPQVSHRVTQGHLFIPSPGLSKHSLSTRNLSLKKRTKNSKNCMTLGKLHNLWASRKRLGYSSLQLALLWNHAQDPARQEVIMRSSWATLLNLQPLRTFPILPSLICFFSLALSTYSMFLSLTFFTVTLHPPPM